MQKEETTGDHQEFDEMYRRTQAEIYKFIRYRVADIRITSVARSVVL